MKRHLVNSIVLSMSGLILLGTLMCPAQESIAGPEEAPKANPLRATGDGVVQTAKAVGGGATEAAVALGKGTAQAADQAGRLWQNAVLPALQRSAQAIPTVAKALVILFVFWIVAMAAGGAVTKLLGLANLDERASRDWGMGKALKGKGGKPRSVQRAAGMIVKWVILLFGFIAFFSTLNLRMVAAPLQGIADRVVGALPNLLEAAVILLVYWAIAALVRMGLTKGLAALKFDELMSRYLKKPEEMNAQGGPSACVGRLSFYVVLLFGIAPFLQALGQASLVAPLQAMLGKALAFLPNLAGAALLLVVGVIVARLVRTVVTNFLSTVGADAGIERLGLSQLFGQRKLSGVVGVIAHFFIIIPIIVAAVDALQIKAVSEPVRDTLGKVLDAVPALLVAAVVIAIGYAIARVIAGVIDKSLKGIDFDALPGKIGLGFLAPETNRVPLSSVLAKFVMVVILLLTAQQALASAGLNQLAEFAALLTGYLPNLIFGVLLLLAALSIGKYVGKLVGEATQGTGYGDLLANVARYAVTFLGAAMAFRQFGLGEEIVAVVVGAVAGGAALALGLAFGLGGKEKAKEILERKEG